MAGKGYTRNGLRQIVPKVKETLLNADGEGATIDVLGEIREIERGLSALRTGTQVEFDSQQHGDVWKIVVPSPNKRAYNTPKIIGSFATAMSSHSWQAFIALWRADVVRLEWQYTKLINMAQKHDVTLVTAQHEITEGDEAHIGVFPGKGYPTYEEVD